MAAAGLRQLFQGRFRILGRAVLPMPLLNFANCYRFAFALDPLDQSTLFVVLIRLRQ